LDSAPPIPIGRVVPAPRAPGHVEQRHRLAQRHHTHDASRDASSWSITLLLPLLPSAATASAAAAWSSGARDQRCDVEAVAGRVCSSSRNQ
jgi:hypothetical protein